MQQGCQLCFSAAGHCLINFVNRDKLELKYSRGFFLAGDYAQ